MLGSPLSSCVGGWAEAQGPGRWQCAHCTARLRAGHNGHGLSLEDPLTNCQLGVFSSLHPAVSPQLHCVGSPPGLRGGTDLGMTFWEVSVAWGAAAWPILGGHSWRKHRGWDMTGPLCSGWQCRRPEATSPAKPSVLREPKCGDKCQGPASWMGKTQGGHSPVTLFCLLRRRQFGTRDHGDHHAWAPLTMFLVWSELGFSGAWLDCFAASLAGLCPPHAFLTDRVGAGAGGQMRGEDHPQGPGRAAGRAQRGLLADAVHC